MPAQREMRFPGIRPQPKCRIYGRLCQSQTSGSVIDLVRVNHIVRKGQLAIGEKEVWIASNCLIQQIHGLGKALLDIETQRGGALGGYLGSVNQRDSPGIKFIGDEVLCWFLFNRYFLATCELSLKFTCDCLR